MVCRMKIVMAVERFMPMLLKMLSAWDLRLSSILKLTCAMVGSSPDGVQYTTTAVSLSSRRKTVQRFRIWGMDALRRVHRVGNLSPAEAAESAEGCFGHGETAPTAGSGLNSGVLPEVAGQPPGVIQSGTQVRTPC